MRKIIVKSFGTYLTGREEGLNVFNFMTNEIKKNPGETFFLDFTDIPVMNHSFADEAFGNIQAEHPNVLIIDKDIPHYLKVAFDVIEETRNLKFNYGTFKDQ